MCCVGSFVTKLSPFSLTELVGFLVWDTDSRVGGGGEG